jgi:signal transduction histidine kinase
VSPTSRLEHAVAGLPLLGQPLPGQPVLDLLGSGPVVLLTAAVAIWWELARRRGGHPTSTRRGFAFWGLATIALLGPLAVYGLTRSDPFDATWIARATSRYEAMWTALDEASLAAAERLEAIDLGAADRLELFRLLTALTRPDGPTYLLLDPEGRAAAWAGEGLLHDLESDALPSTGPAYRAGFSAVTLASVRRVGGQTAAWRLVAGRSWSNQRLPFPSPSGGRRGDYIWSVDAEGNRIRPDAAAVTIEGRPTLAVLTAPEAPLDGPSRRTFLLQLSWIALALALFLVAGTGRAGERLLLGLLDPAAIAGIVALAVGARLPVLHTGLLAAALLTAAAGARLSRGDVLRGGATLAAPLALAAVALLGYVLEKRLGPIDLAATLLPSAEVAALRLTVLFIVLAGFLPALAAAPRSGPGSRRVLWVGALALLATGVALADRWPLALGCLLAGAALASRWLGARSTLSAPSRALAVLTLATLTSAATWLVVQRALTVRYLERDVAPQLGPPSASERSGMRSEVAGFFADFDLTGITAVDPRRLDPGDLAYALWIRSPLASAGKLSSLAVVLGGERVSGFQFGVPLGAAGEVDDSPELWQELQIPGWEGSLIEDRSDLRFAGRGIGTLRWALLPRPGFRLVDEPPEQLAATLVRGTLTSRLPVSRLIDPALYAVYSERLRARVGPREAPPLPFSVRDQASFTLGDRGESFRGWSHGSAAATEVVLLRQARPLESLERAGVHALGVFASVAILVTLLALAAGIRLRDLDAAWSRIYRSYSRKLVLVYGIMLLVPLLAVTLALLGVVGERLERTREVAGLEAMEAAQHVLGEYVLSLEPGFGVETALDDSLLAWISRIVDHEVNLYWGSRLYASSNPELFTAGLLSSRIPGEVFAQLWLESATTASRVNRASGEPYLEIYAPLRIPGVDQQELLFLSIPLLAQQEEVQEELAALRTRAVLAAVLLLIGVAAVGRRLSRGFTKPLTDLISGTESIAAGARSLDLQPTELELAALVRAVNSMAERIAEARERLLVEKQVVDKVLQNITAGVVSLDQENRVLLCNAAAVELIGAAIGQPIEEAISPGDHRRALADFLAEPAELPRQATLRLRDPEGDDREWTVIWVPVPGEGEPSSLLVLEDVTEVLRGQRLEAWAEMARMIAHEIKNPLTPIRLSTEHMIEVHREGSEHFHAVFERCSANILQQVDELQQIASDFSSYSRIPRIRPVPDDLVEVAGEIVDSYRAAPPAGIAIRLENERESLPLAFDRRLLGRALRNLIENAINASVGGGEVLVTTGTADGAVELSVADRGAGADDETLRRMFDPYFSTTSSGTGLGLPISRRIVEEHGGAISAARRDGGGLVVTIHLPAGGDAHAVS